MIELKGTEKQVKWANDIREIMMECLNKSLKFQEEEAQRLEIKKGKPSKRMTRIVEAFKNYIEMAYLQRRRFDYNAEDVANFRRQVREVIVPACQKLYERQRQNLDVWDFTLEEADMEKMCTLDTGKSKRGYPAEFRFDGGM